MPQAVVARDRARLVWGGYVLLCILCFASLAMAQEPQQPTTFQRSGTSTASDQPTTATRSQQSAGPTFGRILLALGVVLGLIFAGRWVSRKLMETPGTNRTSRAIQVISRSMIAPKQHLMLVQVGKRLVLVGNSGANMSPLCEIRDEEEISQVLAQVQAEKSDSISKAFASLFRREEEKYIEPEPQEEEKVPAAEVDRELDPDGPLATTRQELHELLDKVRDMSRQFDRNATVDGRG